jgi:cysteinyl-tRNA synthetase
MQLQLQLYDTLSRKIRPFEPLNPARVRMYVCGPTVYDFAHIGNARPVIVFDVLFRLLQHLAKENGWGEVVYVRNITDVDDKINARAAERIAARGETEADLNAEIRALTDETYKNFAADVAALGCLPPTFEPRATEYVRRSEGMDMVSLIETLIRNDNAYVKEGHVLFRVPSMPDYGALSKRPLDEMIAGARVEVSPYKSDPRDFVLWKPSNPGEPGWESPWGRGRPGWHIECSAMSAALLGEEFDIHGGGIDLIFPHHENEIAQSRCAFHTRLMAQTWMHNGFLQVNGKKMSKSEGNFITIHELLHTNRFGGRSWNGETIRFAMLQTPYREPIDWTPRILEQAASRLKGWKDFAADRTRSRTSKNFLNDVLGLLFEDLDTPAALNLVDRVTTADGPTDRDRYTVYKILQLLGFKGGRSNVSRLAEEITASANNLLRFTANDWKNIVTSVKLNPLLKNGKPKAGTTLLASIELVRALIDDIEPLIRDAVGAPLIEGLRERKTKKFGPKSTECDIEIEDLIKQRAVARASKDFKESDRIRDELAARGVVLKDSKDGTTWEIAR